jgi:nucleosome assembly protein 1-like 1
VSQIRRLPGQTSWHAATGKTRTIKKEVPAESFFNFFSPPQPPSPESLEADDVDEEQLEELDARLETDYQLGEDFKEKIIPRAVDYFTGKALQYEEDFEDEDMEDFDDEDEESDEDEEVRLLANQVQHSGWHVSKGCRSSR